MRIVSLAPSNTEILYALGVEEELLGVTRFCDYPIEAREKLKVGGWLDLDYKKIEGLKPDVAFTSSFVQDKVVEKLRELGIGVLHVDPITLEDVFSSILLIGEAVGRKEKASNLVRGMKERMSKRAGRMKEVKEECRVYAEEWHEPPTVCGNWVPELIELAGGVSLGKTGKHSYEVTSKEVGEFDPNFMIVSWCGFGEKVNVELIKQRKGWEEIDAIKNDKIHIFEDSLLNRPGPRLVDGLEALAGKVFIAAQV